MVLFDHFCYVKVKNDDKLSQISGPVKLNDLEQLVNKFRKCKESLIIKKYI